jgi:hypothetical protein
MSEYNDLLQELRLKITDLQKPIIATAKEYIPKMYKAILNENPNLTPIEVRKRIEKDCREELWSKRTILDALPDEDKDLEKQKAGRQRNKNKIPTSAAMTAAPKLEEKIVIDNLGRIVTDNESLHPESSNNFNSIDRKNKENLEKSSDKSLNGQLLDFEFSLKFKDLRQYMTTIFNRIGDNGDVWFHGKVDKNSGHIAEVNIGRIIE